MAPNKPPARPPASKPSSARPPARPAPQQQRAATPPARQAPPQTAKPSQAVATVPTGGALAGPVPDFMKKHAGRGLEALAGSDYEIPRIKLLQAISTEVLEGGHKPGEFYHTIAEQPMGSELEVVFVYVDKRYILWRPRHDGEGGILARSDDAVHWSPPNGSWEVKPYKDRKETVTWSTAPTVAESGLAEWGSYDPENPDSQPAATYMINLLGTFPDHPDLSPAALTLQRSAVKVARKLLGKIKISGAPIYGLRFMMSSVQDTNSNGEIFFNYKFERIGYVEDEAIFNQYADANTAFGAKGMNINLNGAGDEEAPSGERSDAAPDPNTTDY